VIPIKITASIKKSVEACFIKAPHLFNGNTILPHHLSFNNKLISFIATFLSLFKHRHKKEHFLLKEMLFL
jgi:hypothetical protein